MSDSAKPTVILLFGDDELALQERLTELISRLGDSAVAESNISRFAASRLDLPDFEAQLLAMPFLAPRRMVILDLGAVPGKSPALPDRFYQLLDSIPPTTVLIGLERIDYEDLEKQARRRKRGTSDIHGDFSPFFQWVQAHPEAALAREHRTPRGPSFERWITARALHVGGQIEPDAAALLREYSGEDTLLADQELRKLIDYTDGTRPVGQDDVRKLTPSLAETSIFDLVDAMGTRNGKRAMRLLWRLLEEEDPRYLFSMIARQFRLLVLARQALDDGRSPSDVLAVSPHRLPGFAAERVARQALAFTLPQLKTIYGELFNLDLATKTGRADLVVGLESLVASLAR